MMMESRELVASHFSIGKVSPTATQTSRVESWQSKPGQAKGRSTAVASYDYSYALEDLVDLMRESTDWTEEGLPPSPEALRCAVRVIADVAGAFPPPEVTSRENGTVLLLWHDDRGFISIEIGEREFGLVSSRQGFPSLYINDNNRDLVRQIPRRAQMEIESTNDVAITSRSAYPTFTQAVANAVSRIHIDGEPVVATS
jgi:hypothetical protein